MASFSLTPCETFLKRSWHRVATVFAALIALSGVPVEDAQARSAGSMQAPAHAPASAAPAASAPAPAASSPDVHAAQPAPAQPVESGQPPTAAPTPPHAAAPQAPAGEHVPAAAPATGDAAHAQPPAHGPPAEGAHGAEGAGHGTEQHGESIWATVGRLFNFAVLVGGLIYVLRSPLAQYLTNRSQQIRSGLESARETSAQATSQLAEIDRRLQTLPAELEALRKKGVEEIAAEEQRIQAKAEAERKRLVEEMQRDVDVRVRVARKALAEHAADLAVGLAADRVRQTMTDADQARLIDRYTSQVKDIHG
jgi:F0F1-type ATP synthase membrane subunit b/b'